MVTISSESCVQLWDRSQGQRYCKQKGLLQFLNWNKSSDHSTARVGIKTKYQHPLQHTLLLSTKTTTNQQSLICTQIRLHVQIYDHTANYKTTPLLHYCSFQGTPNLSLQLSCSISLLKAKPYQNIEDSLS